MSTLTEDSITTDRPAVANAVTSPAVRRAAGKNPAIVYAYPDIRWDMVPARQRYLMEAMSAHCPIVFLNGPSLNGQWIEARRPRPQQITDRITVVHDSFCFRYCRLGRKIRPFSSFLDGAWLRQLLSEQGVDDYLFWVAAAQPATLPGMRYKHLIYDCIDPCFIAEKQKGFDRAEMHVARRASVVFCTADSLLERMKTVNPNAYLLNNACSLDEYTPETVGSLELPAGLRGRSKPVIGYMGTIDWRVDTATILAAAKKLPQFTFAIVGRINPDRIADAAALRGLPNVVVPGPVSLEEGRAYAAAFDVGIIPFLPGPIADAINPVKMYMYLAGGKPVVSTWCRECRNNEPLVRAAKTPEEFAAALERAASENSPADIARRVEFASKNTWKDRAASAASVLTKLGMFASSDPESPEVYPTRTARHADHPKVSVIVPAYNPGDYLATAVRSVVAQTFADWELIVIDDGSTQDISAYVGTDPRVRVHRQDNAGLARARNAGIRESRGEFIAFLDADDVWKPEKLRLQIEQLDERPSVGLCDTEFEIIDETGAVTGPGYEGCHETYLDLLTGCGICVSTVLVRRECLDKVGVFDLGVPGCEDYDMWLKVSRHFEMARIGSCQGQYRIHSRNMSRNYSMMYRNYRKVLQKHRDDAVQAGNALAAKAVRAGFRRASSLFATQAIDQARQAFKDRKVVKTLGHLNAAFRINPGILIKSVAGKVAVGKR